MDPSAYSRELRQDNSHPHIFIDPKLGDSAYVDNFGFEWTVIKGMVQREVLNAGVFPMFLLPKNYFNNRNVVEVGCGNGRVGSIVAPMAKSYTGFDLSESLYAFPEHTQKPEDFQLVRASGTDLPLNDNTADVTLSIGVLHHMDDYEKGLDELIRITKPGGVILLYIYWQGLTPRQSITSLAKSAPPEEMYEMLKYLSNGLDLWRETDGYFGMELANLLYYTPSATQAWSTHQWFDGITPAYHWCLCEWAEKRCQELGVTYDVPLGGTIRIQP